MVENVSAVSFDMISTSGTVSRQVFNGKIVAFKHYAAEVPHFVRLNELNILWALDHPNIVEVIAAGPSIGRGEINFIMTQFSECGDLRARMFILFCFCKRYLN